MRRTGATANRAKPLRPPALPTEPLKVSEAITEIIEPFVEDVSDDRSWKTAIGMAVLTWNLAQAPEEEQEKLFGEMLEDLNESVIKTAAEIPGETAQAQASVRDYLEMTCRLMLERKKLLFPDDTRLIREYKVVGEGQDLKLLVESVGSPPP